jgi:tRNA pseudouridine55 synthase
MAVSGNSTSLENSVILLDKPEGRTSYQVIAEMKRLLGVKKIGHSGTLDKFATGLLIICTGQATKLTTFFLDSDKRYAGRIRLGVVTDTGDPEGNITARSDVGIISEESLLGVKEKFTGNIVQTPPVYSAVKIDGKRASDIARSGKDVRLKQRDVIIRELNLKLVPGDNSAIDIEVACTKGTYIRSLSKDIGEYLGTGAYLESLRRLASGRFSIDDSITMKELADYAGGAVFNRRFFFSPFEALSDFGIITVKPGVDAHVTNGVIFPRNDASSVMQGEKNRYRVLDDMGNLIALAEADIDNWSLKYLNVFKKV